MQHGEGVPGEETRGACTGWSGDADRDVRGRAQARASGRDAGERSRGCGFGIRVNVEEGLIKKQKTKKGVGEWRTFFKNDFFFVLKNMSGC